MYLEYRAASFEEIERNGRLKENKGLNLKKKEKTRNKKKARRKDVRKEKKKITWKLYREERFGKGKKSFVYGESRRGICNLIYEG